MVIILSVHTSGIANNAVFLSWVNVILNNKSSNIYFSTNVSTFPIAALVLGNLF